ncbi:MAG TPA: secretin and TonB N-terminal domain-containing protein, partial [Sphingomonadaceae bacterium]|nr:secretin and TonB N-terminal domain-containing protein [Sphingomonadaceae bacterium]
VDAGDAGIRVSGNFNVYAIEILGTDNIDVAGVSSGLPVRPAAPPTSLDVDDAATTSAAVSDELERAVAAVRQNAAIVPPSLIEVLVTGFGVGCEGDDCADQGPAAGPLSMGGGNRPVLAATPVSMQRQAAVQERYAFELPPQPLDDAIRAIGRLSGFNILYDAHVLDTRMTRQLRGKMTPEEALLRLLAGYEMELVRVGPRTIMLRRKIV